MPHKNSQKRYYDPNFVYFITVKTHQNHPYFEEGILCELWIEELKLCKELKKFELYAFCLLPDHFHIVLKCTEENNISKVMHFLKRHFSRNTNIILGYNEFPEGEDGHPRLQETMQMDTYTKNTHQKFLQIHSTHHNIPKFKWQSSFHDHVIRDENDLHHHTNYTEHNFLKHHLPETWEYTSKNYPKLIDPLFS